MGKNGGLASRLTRRQTIALAAVLAVSSVVIVTSMAGRLGWAIAALAVLPVIAFAAALRIQRRLEKLHQLVYAESHRTGRLVTEETRAHAKKSAERMDIAHRRLMAVVENERLAAADRQHELLAAVDRQRSDLNRVQSAQTSEVEALLQLFQGFRPRAPMPPSGRWALNPTGLLNVLHLISRSRPQLVVELGSGTSTVWIAYALETSGGRLVSFDHSTDFAERTRSLLIRHDLEHVAEVRHAPLKQLGVRDESFSWYDPTGFEDLKDVDLLLVDGPPGTTGPEARFPALQVLEKRLSNTAVVVLDDADRPDESQVVCRWLDSVPGLARERGMLGRQAILSYARERP